MIKERIAEYVRSNGIKQKYICEKTGMTQQALCTLLNGKRSLEIEEYVYLCDALNVPYNLFFSNANKKTSDDQATQ